MCRHRAASRWDGTYAFIALGSVLQAGGQHKQVQSGWWAVHFGLVGSTCREPLGKGGGLGEGCLYSPHGSGGNCERTKQNLWAKLMWHLQAISTEEWLHKSHLLAQKVRDSRDSYRGGPD